MTDLIDFSEFENDENICPDDEQENRAPKLVQSPVIVNPILKQSTKDNLIQLYTPVQKPVKGKLKVTFGHDTVLQTPNVKKPEKAPVKLQEVIPDEQNTDDQENEDWRDRTSVLTSIDHQDYTAYAREFLEEIIQAVPIREETRETSFDSGVDSTCPMDCSGYESTITEPFSVQTDNNSNNNNAIDIIAEAEALLQSLINPSIVVTKEPEEEYHVSKETLSAAESEEEFMDCEEYMEVDSEETGVPLVTETSETVLKTAVDSTQTETPSTQPAPSSDANTAQPTEIDQLSKDDGPDSSKATGDGKTDSNDVDVINKDVIQQLEENAIKHSAYEESFVKDNKSDQKSEERSEENAETDTNTNNNQQLPVSEEASPTNPNSLNAPTFNDIDDQPILPKKGVYNFDEMDFDSIDPFKSKSQIVNSPNKNDGIQVVEKTEVVKPELENCGVNGSLGEEAETETISNVCAESDIKNEYHTEIQVNQDKQHRDQKDSDGHNSLPTDNDIKPQKTNQVDAENKESSAPEKGHAETVTQSVDFLSIEDPFKPKNQMLNSPVVKSNEKAAIDFEKIEDPFKPRNQMMNSPVTTNKMEPNVSDLRSEVGVSNMAEVEDPFKPRSQIVNSPVKQQQQKQCVNETESIDDPLKPEIQNSPRLQKHDDKHSDKPEMNKAGVVDTPKDEQTKNSTDNQIKNSTEIGQETTLSTSTLPNKEKAELNFDEIENPFQTKSQVANSPTAKIKDDEINFDGIEDPFKPKNQMVNSPVRTENKTEPELQEVVDPSKPKDQMANSLVDKTEPEVNFDDIQDPFQPKNQMANSPQKKTKPEENFEQIKDPFKPKNQMVNSPPEKPSQEGNLEEIEDPIKPKKQVADSPSGKQADMDLNLEEIDEPFKPRKQMANSPAEKNAKQEVNFEEIDDPFKPKKQMANSPLKKDEKSDIDFENIEDPFKPKTQMMNSPAQKEREPNLNIDEIGDPFKPKKQMMNSPINKEKESLEVNFEDIVDPFKPKTQMQNSPAIKKIDSMILDEMKDPFSPRTQTLNALTAVASCKTMDRNASLQSSEELDSTLKDTSPTPNSRSEPKTKGLDSTPKSTGLTPGSRSGSKTKGLDSTPKATGFTPGSRSEVKSRVSLIPTEIGRENQEDIIEITSVTRRGDQPQNAKIANFDDLDIDENQFVSAAEVFNDPGMLDLLEQFGDPSTKQQESSLSRMSLYVKFDPLVEEAPNPRRFSVRPDQIEKIREYGLDDCLLLLGTPPRKKRQSLSVSSIRNSICPQFSLDRERVQSPLVNETGEVDKILACSPTKHKGDTPPTLKMPSLMGDMLDGDTGLFEELKYTETDMKTLRNSLQMELQGVLLEKEREKFEMKKGLETKMEQLKQQLDNKDKMLEDLEELRSVCDMFEHTCMELKEKHKKELEKMQSIREERDSALSDVQSVEKAFTDLHKRYEKSKSVLEAMKKNEDALKKYATECHENLNDKQKQIATMKKAFEEKSKSQQQEIDTKTKQLDECQNKLEAQAKVFQMKNESLEKQLQQKIAENKELTDICDKLLSRNG